MKNCPYCGEEIANNVKKCKYCWKAVFERKRIWDFRNFRLCPYCEAEISETARKCKYCWEWLNEEKKYVEYESGWKTVKWDKIYSHEIMREWYKLCPYCGEEIRELAKKCRYCGEFLNEKSEEKDEDIVEKNKNEKSYRSWEELSSEEQKYIIKKLMWMRIFTVFLTWIWLMRCKRWWAFFGCLAISLILWLIWWPLGLLSLIITRIIALVSFSKKAYEHDRLYFQKYLVEYAQLYKKF
jgi:hypothetical protein